MAATQTNDDADNHRRIIEQAMVEANLRDLNQAVAKLKTKERIDRCLSNAYHRLKLLNVPLEDAVENYAVDKLVSVRFFCDKTPENLKDVPSTLDDVLDRTDRLVRLIDKLTTKFGGITLVKNLFVCLCRLTARHVHILKHQLKSTYDRLPWAEMEFCFVALVLNIVAPGRADDVFKLVLHRERVLRHLAAFKDGLLKLRPQLSERSIGQKLQLANRARIVQSVLTFLPEFRDLYHDYDLIRDISSLRRIDRYISLCNNLTFDEDEEHDKLVVERTLQAIGETLKSTPDSPNVSSEVQAMLVRSTSSDLKDILISLRDSLSHTESLMQKVDAENTNAPGFFERLRDDLAKIHVEIVHILLERRLKALELFCRNVLQCEDIAEVRRLAESIDSFNDVDVSEVAVRDLVEMGDLVELVKEQLGEVLPEEQVLFDKIDEIIRREKGKVQVSVRDYTSFTWSVRFAICEIKRSDDFAYVRQLFTLILEVLPQSGNLGNSTTLRSIGEPIVSIQRSVRNRLDVENHDQIDKILEDILHIAMVSSESSSHIDRFKSNLESSDYTDAKHRRYIDDVLDKVEGSLKTERERVAFGKAVASKQEISRMRLDLINLIVDRQNGTADVDAGETVASLLKKFKLRKQTEEAFMNNYANRAYRDCLDTVKKIDDTYAVFVQRMTDLDVFSFRKQQEALKIFLSSLKVKKFALDDVMRDFVTRLEADIQRFIVERTDTLKNILCSLGVKDVQSFCREMHENDSLKVITELILLDVLNILQKASLFVDDKLFFDDASPLLLGQSLRNYLAHGNTFVDILPFDVDKTLACNAYTLLQHGQTLLTNKEVLIGKRGSEQLFKATFYLEGMDDLVVQNLFYATVQSNNVANIAECLNQGASMFGRDIDDQNALHFAASSDSLESLQFCTENGLNGRSVDVFGQTPFDVALQHGSSRCVRHYLDQPDANVDIDHAFTVAGKCARLEILRLLVGRCSEQISAGAVAEVVEFAAQLGHDDVLRLILDGVGDGKPEVRDVHALHLASFYGHGATVELLLGRGFDVNKTAPGGQLALHGAVLGGHRDIVEVLLRNGSWLEGAPDPAADDDDDDDDDDDREESALVSPSGQLKALTTPMMFGEAAACSPRAPSALGAACSLDRPRIVELLLRAAAGGDGGEAAASAALHRACDVGAAEVVDILLAAGADVNKTAEGGVRAAHRAAGGGHVAVLAALVRRGCDLDAATDDGKTPLHLAVQAGHRDVVAFLLEKGASVGAVNEEGRNALHLASQSGGEDILDQLLEHVDDDAGAGVVDLADGDGNTALHFAAGRGAVACVRHLAERGAACDPVNAARATPLLWAAQGGHDGAVAALLAHAVDADAVDPDGHGALHLACRNGRADAVRALLAAGAAVDLANPRGVTPLHVAASHGRAACCAALAAGGARLDAPAADGRTPLRLAAEEGREAAVGALLEAGAAVDLADGQGVTPLLAACRRGHRRVAELLLGRGADAGAEDAAGWTAAHVAALGGHLDVVRALPAALLARMTGGGETVLHAAAEGGNAALVRHLVLGAAGVPVDAVDEEGYTALHVAAQGAHAAVVGALLGVGARADAAAGGGVTALHMAADGGGGAAVVVALTGAGAVLEAALEGSGETALHVAAGGGNAAATGALLAAGAEPGARDGEGRTPLDRAAQAGHADVVVLLLEAAATGRIELCDSTH